MVNADGMHFMFILMVLEKNQRHKAKMFPRKHNSLIKDGEL